jgi:flavodoxin I
MNPENPNPRIAVVYGSTTGATRTAARRVVELLAPEEPELIDAADATPDALDAYDVWVCGVSTWGLGEMQEDWSLLAHRLEKADLGRLTAAVFGLGDQKTYPDTFCNAMGELARLLRSRGARLVGRWGVEDYRFSGSTAVEDGAFLGLALDQENQPTRSEERLRQWVGQLRAELDG